MIKKRTASKLALNAETIRQLTNDQLRTVAGGASKPTVTSCSSRTDEYTCCTSASCGVTEDPDGCVSLRIQYTC